MLNSQKDALTKNIRNFTDLSKVILSIFLLVIVLFWLAQIFRIDMYIPFNSAISSFLTDFNSHFVTQNMLDEENNNIMYLSLNITILFIILSFVSDLVKDMLQMYERSKEEAIEEDNLRINEEINRNYETHLKNSMQFVLIIKLKVHKDSYQDLAFSDAEYLAKQQAMLDKMLSEVKNIINGDIKCEKSTVDDNIVLYIPNAEQLNKILVFLKSLFRIEKYVKLGLEYYMSVATHTVNENPKVAVDEALVLINLNCKNKIVCYQIISECLNTVEDSKFAVVANGNYADLPDSLYELVEKREDVD